MRPLSANVLERIVTGSQEGVPGQVARRMSKHLAAEKRLESREKEISRHVCLTVQFCSELNLAQFFGNERC